MAGRINLDDIPADVRASLNLPGAPAAPKRKRGGMTMDEVRSSAIRVLAVVAGLSRAERAKVLRHALKVNDV